MSNKKRTTEEFDHRDQWNQTTYQTGSTRPPKSHGGPIAFLIGLVIFLSGISTALGLMNIRLFRQLTAQATEPAAPVAFAHRDHSDLAAPDDTSVYFPLGFFGQAVPAFWNLYQDIPQGIYITEVRSGSDAAQKGLSAGDILVSVSGAPVTDVQTLTDLLNIHTSGEPVEVTICREGQNFTLQLLLDEREE